MKYPLYSYKDEKVGFMPPVCESSDVTAVRRFTYDINTGNDFMGQFPDDYKLYKVGEFDTDKGKINTIVPELIVDGRSVFGVNVK